MINIDLDREKAVLHVRPTGPLREEDFDDLAKSVDPFIEETGGLAGLIIETSHFRGWENLGTVARHFRFVRDHQKKINKVAVVTDSVIGNAAELLASHFLSAEIKHFQGGKLEEAKLWIIS